jgi:hypothetical protein
VDPFCKDPHTTSFVVTESRLEKWVGPLTCYGKLKIVLGKRSKVCFKHFPVEFIKQNKNRMTLTPDAVPTLFPDRPLYLQAKRPRLSLEERCSIREAEKAAEEMEKLKAEKRLLQLDKITSFDQLVKEFDSKMGSLRSRFLVSSTDSSISLILVRRNISEALVVSRELRIYKSLEFSIYTLGVQWDRKQITELFGLKRKFDLWTMLATVSKYFISEDIKSPMTYVDSANGVLEELEVLISEVWPELREPPPELERFEEQLKKISFLREQLKLLNMASPRYSKELFMIAAHIR